MLRAPLPGGLSSRRACAGAPLPQRGLRPQAKKRWETQPVNERTGKPVQVKVHVKQGDLVKVIAGGDKGQTGTVLKVFRDSGLIMVKDVNVKTKHNKPRAEGEAGNIERKEAPFHHSQVQPVTAAGDVSRVGHTMVDGKKRRVLVKTGELLAEPPFPGRAAAA